MTDALRQLYWLLWKDLLLEVRRRDNLLSMFFFGLSLLFLFSFAFEISTENVSRMAPGLLWLAFMFSGNLALERCSRAVILNRGRIVFDEPRQDPWDSFHTAFDTLLSSRDMGGTR